MEHPDATMKASPRHEAGLYVSAITSLLIKEYGNNSLRKVKTDKVDAMKIAKYALDNWTELRDYTHMDTIRYDLKTLFNIMKVHLQRPFCATLFSTC